MTKKKIMNGNGMFFESMAEAPTVTLPRIKSLVSGSVPTFFDFVMNFGASKMTAPNIIEDLAENKNKKVVFYGDETWIKLFPDTFTRSEGTSSFFVSVIILFIKLITTYYLIICYNIIYHFLNIHFKGYRNC